MRTSVKGWFVVLAAALATACSSDGTSGGQDGTNNDSGAGMGASGASAAGSGGMAAGMAGMSSAGSSGTGSAGMGAPDGEARPDYGDPVIEPDTSTEKVADCANAPDMTLCDVVTEPDRWYDVCVGGTCVSPGCGDASCNTPGPHFRIPPFEGHIYLEKLPGDEPVTIDKITGLHWTSCPAGLRGEQCDVGTPLEFEFEEALAHCDGLSWGGHDDWYLPDIWELTSLADLTADASPTASGRRGFLSDRAFPNQRAVNAFYWSTTRLDNRFQTFSTGQNQGSFPSIVSSPSFPPYPVLCVRRGFSKAMPDGERFAVHGRGQGEQPWTEDRVTGLVFQGCPSGADGACGGMHTVADASAHCSALQWGGADDWRLPTYKELQALFDLSAGAFDQALPAELFGTIRGPYVLAGPGALLDLGDMSRVGIGIPDKTYPVLCAHGPYSKPQ